MTKTIEIPPGYLNIMGYVNKSQVNGPGCRAVVWVQGCHIGCADCFNPDSWPFEVRELISVEKLAENILANPDNNGVTFTGGEPFWQAKSLARVARIVKASGLNVMCYTGFPLEKLQSEYALPGSQDLLKELDILIDGTYIKSLTETERSHSSVTSSSNQRVHIFNPIFREKIHWGNNQAEVHHLIDGNRIVTGRHGWFEEC
jgi:anaerobic ribonucleoside-triphosphate reductase activating protein